MRVVRIVLARHLLQIDKVQDSLNPVSTNSPRSYLYGCGCGRSCNYCIPLNSAGASGKTRVRLTGNMLALSTIVLLCLELEDSCHFWTGHQCLVPTSGMRKLFGKVKVISKQISCGLLVILDERNISECALTAYEPVKRWYDTQLKAIIHTILWIPRHCQAHQEFF